MVLVTPTLPRTRAQVLNLLLGDASSCFEAAPARAAPPPPHCAPAPAFAPTPGLHVPYLSQGALHAVLREFAAAGSQVAWLRAAVASCAQGQAAVRAPGLADALQATPCCVAMLQAAGAQLRSVSGTLIGLQQANRDAGPGGGLSLLQLRAACEGPMRRVGALHGAVRAALAAQAAAERAAQGSSASGGGAVGGDAAAGGGLCGRAAACGASCAVLDALLSRLQVLLHCVVHASFYTMPCLTISSYTMPCLTML